MTQLVTLVQPKRGPFGSAPLPSFTVQESRDLEDSLKLAYASVGNGRAENFGIWNLAHETVIKTLRRKYSEAGWLAPPLNEDLFWSRVDIPGPQGDALSHLRLVRALVTSYEERLAEHIRYRMTTGGNVHLEFTGPTGMGKSSCALSLADWITPIEPSDVEKHVNFDLGGLAARLVAIKPRQTVVQDEFLQGSGEGSRTMDGFFANLEDTLRASQKNLFVLSPRNQEHGTMQARLELVLWNPGAKSSLFVVWTGEVPQGIVSLPWARADLWKAYGPWKEENVKRSQAGQFKDVTFLAKQALALTADDRFVEFICALTNKPKLKDIRGAIEIWPTIPLSSTQADRVATMLYEMAYAYQRLAPRFETLYGLKPNRGLEQIAEKCYDE